MVEVPRSTLTDDYAMMGNLTARPFGSHRDMLAVWIDEFDVLYREAETEPRLLSINWHQCMLGRPAGREPSSDRGAAASVSYRM